MAKFRDATGRIVMRSTKQEVRKEAAKVAESWEDASRKARRGELTQVASIKILSELLAATSGEQLKVPTIAEVLNSYVASRATVGCVAGTAKRYQKVVSVFLEKIGEKRSAASVASLTPIEIEKWRDSELDAGKSPKTVNDELGIIRAALNGSKRRGEMLSNPAEAIETVSGHVAKRQPFSDAEITELLSKASADWKTAILLGAWTGLRLGDIASLTWSAIDLEAGKLSLTPKKTKEAVEIALAPELRDHLASLTRGVGKAPLMPSLNGRGTGSNGELGGLSTEFMRLMKKTTINAPKGAEKKGKGRQTSSKSFHSLRHSFVSRCAASGAGDSVTKSMTGHSTESAFRRYVHIGLDNQRSVLGKLTKLGA